MANTLEEIKSQIQNLSLEELAELQLEIAAHLRRKIANPPAPAQKPPLDWQSASPEEIIAELHASRVERNHDLEL